MEMTKEDYIKLVALIHSNGGILTEEGKRLKAQLDAQMASKTSELKTAN